VITTAKKKKKRTKKQNKPVQTLKDSSAPCLMRLCNVHYLLHSKSPPYLELALFTRTVSSGFMEFAKACQPIMYGRINCIGTRQKSITNGNKFEASRHRETIHIVRGETSECPKTS
jgi:hypothetical protein